METLKKYILNYKVASIIGILTLLSGLYNPTDNGSLFVAGFVILLGVFAYRSAKTRLLTKNNSSTIAITFELAAIGVILFLVFMQNDYRTLAIEDPVPNLIIPAWVLIAYLTINLKARTNLTEQNTQT